MNKLHGKRLNQLVYDYKISHLDIIPTPPKLSLDKMFKRYIRRYNTYNNMKGVKYDQFSNRIGTDVVSYLFSNNDWQLFNRLLFRKKAGER